MEIFEWTNTYTNDFYTPVHIVQIGIMIVAMIAAAFIFYKRKNIQNKMYIFLAVSTNAITLTAFIYSLITGVYHLEWYVPLHICNLFVVISVLSCIFKKKVRNFLNEYMVYCGIGGCLIGIIIPASTLYYFPAYSFISMIVWVYHIIIGIMAVYLIASGVVKVRFYNCWKALSILLPLAVVAVIFNSIFNTNFIGLNRFKPILGLDIVANITGKFYVPTLFAMLILTGVTCTATSLLFNAKKIKLIAAIKSILLNLSAEQSKMFTYWQQLLISKEIILDALLSHRLSHLTQTLRRVSAVVNQQKILLT